MARILIAEDQEGIRAFLGEVLEDLGHDVTEVADGSLAEAQLRKSSFHLLLSDLRMPGIDGLELLKRAREEWPEMEVVMLTAHGSVESAVQAMKLGAFDFLTKPLSGPAELRLVVERALEHGRLRLHRERATVSDVDLIAIDPRSRAVVEQLDKVAPTNATVLLLGESGTGKEVAARRIHDTSPRRGGPFVAVNCAAVSSELVESEMFGHEKGAFTGATERRRGRFELADGGTLFLDEVAELPAALQAKLLRVLQQRSFERVGGSKEIHVDVRIVAATNRNLGNEIREGRFRDDLYHRLAVFPVSLLPLRDRPGDVLPLAEHLLGRIARDLRRSRIVLDDDARSVLQGYPWPGNVRELANALERAAILSGEQAISRQHLVLGMPSTEVTAKVDDTLESLERQAIERALRRTEGHRRQAAAMLGIGLRTLYEKLKQYGIT